MPKSQLSTEQYFASSILYYEPDEMSRVVRVFDAMMESEIPVDGNFSIFIDFVKGLEINDPNPEARRDRVISAVLGKASSISSKASSDRFLVWFNDVQEISADLDLAEDIRDKFLWESFKKSIDRADKSSLSYADKLSVKPSFIHEWEQDRVARISTIGFTEVTAAKYTTGIKELDEVVHLTPQNFAVVAARPGVGKSLLMLQSAVENARIGRKSCFISLELSAASIKKRVLSYFANENLEDKFRGLENCSEKLRLEQERLIASDSFAKIDENFLILENVGTSAETIISKIEELIETEGVECVFIDYLQMLNYRDKDEWASLRMATKELKKLAFRNDILVVSASQVSRTSTDTGLYLTDLFGASSIESDTDVVIGLESNSDKRIGNVSNILIKVLKNREGAQGQIKSMIDYATGTITVLASD